MIGTPGTVSFVESDGRTFHVQLQGGGAARVGSGELVSLSRGDSVLVSQTGWHALPKGTWLDPVSVGVVRKVFKKGVLLETNLGIRLIKKRPRKRLGLAPGNTVEYDEQNGVTKVISASPIRLRDVGVDDDVLTEYEYSANGQERLSFDSFGGYESVVTRAKELIETQLEHREELREIGAQPVKGVIFTGPPGTGKTHLARIIAQVSEATFYLVSGPSIVSKWVGDSEETLRRLFAEAATQERAIIFFDEIDSIAARRGNDSNGESKRVVAQLLTLLDGFEAASNVVVIAATNRIEDIDEALLRPGRFDWEIEFALPSVQDRYEILQVRAKGLKTVGVLPLEEIAQLTDGWSGAMLTAIWTEAAILAASDKRQAIADEDMARAYERVTSRPVHAKREAAGVL
ncbi:hypothetical protein ASD16_12010 [Cellulomonas sp. Root485]|nr:hypothetical protein ASD16_12010 [Cellulomonas sp. Root485]